MHRKFDQLRILPGIKLPDELCDGLWNWQTNPAVVEIEKDKFVRVKNDLVGCYSYTITQIVGNGALPGTAAATLDTKLSKLNSDFVGGGREISQLLLYRNPCRVSPQPTSC